MGRSGLRSGLEYDRQFLRAGDQLELWREQSLWPAVQAGIVQSDREYDLGRFGPCGHGKFSLCEFYLKAVSLTTNAGWTFQLDAATGYVTRLGELDGTDHNWKLYHYDLLPVELVSNLGLSFQFAGGGLEPD